jgi:site-specific DNA-methyltransferase (adenine-specific)
MTTNIIYNEDCLEGMKKIPTGSIDMILCDLPYGTTACKWDSIIPFEPLWEQYNRVIKDNGAIVLFGSEPFSTRLRMSNIKHYKYDWIWKKNTCTGFQHAKNAPLKDFETISVFSKGRMGHANLLKEKRMNYNPQGLLPCENYKKGKASFGGIVGETTVTQRCSKARFHKLPQINAVF